MYFYSFGLSDPSHCPQKTVQTLSKVSRIRRINGRCLMCDYKSQVASTSVTSCCAWKHICTEPYGIGGYY